LIDDDRLVKETVLPRLALSVAAGFYRICIIDGLLDHSPAEHVRRPSVPAESPTLVFTHLQFEALLTTAHDYAGQRIRMHGSRDRRWIRHQDRVNPAASPEDIGLPDPCPV
jgi:hypothetical protein